MTVDNKTAIIKIRVDQQFKDTFMEVCQANDINSSALIRRLIAQWIAEQTSPTTPHNRGTDL